MTAKTYRVGPFPAGMTNRAPDFALKLPMGAGHLLRDALNVDVTAEGSVKTRKGLAATAGESSAAKTSSPSRAQAKRRTMSRGATSPPGPGR